MSVPIKGEVRVKNTLFYNEVFVGIWSNEMEEYVVRLYAKKNVDYMEGLRLQALQNIHIPIK